MIVLPNLYGDIVSDLGAGMIGGLGLAPGGNVGTEAAMFEATHGSAPKYKGQNKVNPTALMLSGVLMLHHLDERDGRRQDGEGDRRGDPQGREGHLRPQADARRSERRRHLRVRRRRDRGDEHMSTSPVRVAVTGAAGQIGYPCCSASPTASCRARQPVHLNLLEIPDAVKAAEGVAMELDDCAFPLLARHRHLRRPEEAFDGANIALLVGARPRSQGNGACRPARGQRRHLQGAGQGDQRRRGRRHQGAGGRNPANTNCLIAMNNAPDIPRERFTAMTRLDHNRALAQLAKKARCARSATSPT